MIKKSILGLSAIALVQATSVQAMQKGDTCMPREDFESIVVAILPAAVNGVQDKCSSVLPTDSALLTTDVSKGSVIKMASDAAWPKAAGSVRKLFDEDMAENATPEVLQMFGDLMIGSMIKQEVKTEDCQDIENIYAPIAVLPPENLAAFTSALLVLGMKDKQKGKDIPEGSVCF